MNKNQKTTSPTPPKEGLKNLEKPGYVTANPLSYKHIKEIRDTLKNNPTHAEKIIWEYLRNKKTGHKIRKQHIIDNFITDFVCLAKKVVIEIDGNVHLFQKEYDELRTERLSELNFRVIRFSNKEVCSNPERVAAKIKKIIDDMIQSSPPSEGRGRSIFE